MATKQINLSEDVYDRLQARNRSGETISETIERLLADSAADWRDGFGTLSTEEAIELERVVSRSRNAESTDDY